MGRGCVPTIILHMNENRQLAGITARDQRAYEKFKQKIKELGDGSMTFSYRLPRSGPFHRRFFAIVNSLFEAQDAFKDIDMFRKWLEVSAGYAKFVPMQSGEICAIPDSISYDRLDQSEFQEISEKIFDFIRSEHARRFLWPWMSDGVSMNMIIAILGEFEKNHEKR